MVLPDGLSGCSNDHPGLRNPCRQVTLEHGYDQARSFIKGVHGHWERSDRSLIGVLTDE
jgi:hypothetical protein